MEATPTTHPPEQTQLTKCERNTQSLAILPVHKIQTVTNIRIENMDIILTAFVSICNRQLDFLIDCGAHASMLKSTCLGTNVIYYPQIKYSMVGINGPKNAILTHGATYGNITINCIKLKQQFQIAGEDLHLSYDGILGMDFLMAHKAITDIENLKPSLLLPKNHNLHEFDERQTFEKSNPQILKKQIKNKLIYLSDECSKNELGNESIKIKKIAKMDIRINSLGTLQLKNDTGENKIQILPNSRKTFAIDTKIPLLAKGKAHECGLLIPDTIVSSNCNRISVHNTSCTEVSVPTLDVEIEPISNCNIFKINDLAKFARTVQEQQVCEKRADVILNSLDLSHCNEQEKAIITKLIQTYSDVFHLDGDGLTFANEGEHQIHTKPGTNPVNTKQYRIPHGQKPLIREKIEEMLKQGIIERSTSVWNSPILLRTFPMPNLEEELAKMKGSNIFSTLDIASAYHQIMLNAADREKTAFTAENQKFHFNRMPFGLAGVRFIQK